MDDNDLDIDDKFVGKNDNKPNGIGQAGGILNIVFSSLGIVFLAYTIILIMSIPAPYGGGFILFLLFVALIGQIASLVFNILFLKNYKFKVAAGVLGLIFSGLLGGIFVLVSEPKIQY